MVDGRWTISHLPLAISHQPCAADAKRDPPYRLTLSVRLPCRSQPCRHPRARHGGIVERMSPSDNLTVRGFVADRDTGAGLAGLRVELWGANGHGPSLIAASQSDAAGGFRFRLPGRLAARRDDPHEVEWRVVDRGRVVLRETRELPAGRSDQVELTVPSESPFEDAEEASTDPEFPTHHEVVGHVKGPALEGATVRAVLKTLRSGTLDEEVVAQAAVNSAGRYRLSFERPAHTESADTSLTVRLYSSRGDLIAESTPILARPGRMRVDVRPPRAAAIPSEYALLERRIAESLQSGPAGLDGAEADVLDEVSDWLDVDRERLTTFQRARALDAATAVPAPAYYALGRSGMSLQLEDLLDVPMHELRTTIDEAAAVGIVDRATLGNVDTIVEQIAHHIVEHGLRPDARALYPGLGEVLTTANLPRDTLAGILRTYQTRTGSPSDFWASFTESAGAAEGVGDDVAREMEVAVRLSTIVGPDAPVLQRMQSLRQAGRWHQPEDLARITFDEWCELLEDVEAQEGPAEDEGDDAESDEEAQRRIEARAEAILDTLEDIYPSRFIQQRLAESDDVSLAARSLLGRVPDHDFHRESIRDRTAADPALLEGIDAGEVDAALEEVEAVERVSRIADRADEVAVLVGTGMNSAMRIATTPKNQFIARYGEALGGRAQAARVHAQAQQAAAASKLTAIRLLQSLQHVPFVLGSPPSPAIAGVPDARTLFQQAGGFCDCEHCGSVYSPAAYFVDLLRYLNVSSPERLTRLQKPTGVATSVLARLGRSQPLDVRLGRRPGPADLPLPCERTHA